MGWGWSMGSQLFVEKRAKDLITFIRVTCNHQFYEALVQEFTKIVEERKKDEEAEKLRREVLEDYGIRFAEPGIASYSATRLSDAEPCHVTPANYNGSVLRFTGEPGGVVENITPYRPEGEGILPSPDAQAEA